MNLYLDDAVWLAARDAVRRVLPRASAAQLIELPAAVANLAETLAAQAHKVAPPERPVACRAGCGYCCHISVAATPAEVFRLAVYIRHRFPTGAQASLKKRLRQAAAMSREERFEARLPCPLLLDNNCSAYEARPINCRGLESMDAESCRRASYGEIPAVPIYMAHWRLFNRALAAMVTGAAEAGRRNEQLDLFRALLIALERRDAVGSWLRGKPVFSSCLWLPS